MRGGAQAPEREAPDQASGKKERQLGGPRLVGCVQQRCSRGECDDGVVVPGRHALDALAVGPRVFLVEQRVEVGVVLAAQARAPGLGRHRVHHHGLFTAPDGAAGFEQAKLQVGFFAPGALEALVETAHGLQRALAHEGIGANEFGVLEASRAEFVVGRPRVRRAIARWHHHPPAHGHEPLGRVAVLEGCSAAAQPIGRGQGVVVGEGNERRPGGAPAGIARDRRAATGARAQVAQHWRPGVGAERFDQRARLFVVAVVDHHDLERLGIEALHQQGVQAAAQRLGSAMACHHHHRNQRRLAQRHHRMQRAVRSTGGARRRGLERAGQRLPSGCRVAREHAPRAPARSGTRGAQDHPSAAPAGTRAMRACGRSGVLMRVLMRVLIRVRAAPARAGGDALPAPPCRAGRVPHRPLPRAARRAGRRGGPAGRCCAGSCGRARRG